MHDSHFKPLQLFLIRVDLTELFGSWRSSDTLKSDASTFFLSAPKLPSSSVERLFDFFHSMARVMGTIAGESFPFEYFRLSTGLWVVERARPTESPSQ